MVVIFFPTLLRYSDAVHSLVYGNQWLPKGLSLTNVMTCNIVLSCGSQAEYKAVGSECKQQAQTYIHELSTVICSLTFTEAVANYVLPLCYLDIIL